MKYKFKNELETAELYIYDDIDNWWGISAGSVKEEIDKANGKPLNIHINSGGGDVFEGLAIYNLIKNYAGYTTVYIDGIAASIASIIAMAGKKILMNKASMMMIHNASSCCWGNAEEMEKVAEVLHTIDELLMNVYKGKTNMSDEDIKNLMDSETFMTSQTCLDYGFCDEIVEDEPSPEQQVDTTNSMKTFLMQVDNRLKTMNDLKQAFTNFGFEKENKKEDAFLNTKKRKFDWLKGKEL